MPHPDFENLASDLKFLSTNNVKYVFEQGNSLTNGIGYFEPLKAWVVSHLMWNPSLNQDSLTSVFLNGYYGKAWSLFKGLYAGS